MKKMIKVIKFLSIWSISFFIIGMVSTQLSSKDESAIIRFFLILMFLSGIFAYPTFYFRKSLFKKRIKNLNAKRDKDQELIFNVIKLFKFALTNNFNKQKVESYATKLRKLEPSKSQNGKISINSKILKQRTDKQWHKDNQYEPSLINKLKDLAITGEQITIYYNGGTSPGESRSIIVRSVNKDSINAVCLKDSSVKTFKLHKIIEIDGHYKKTA